MGFVMRKPILSEFTDDDGTIDHEGFEDQLGTYEDIAYDEWRDRQDEEGDRIHEQRKDEKDEQND